MPYTIFFILFILSFTACSSKSAFITQDELQAQGSYSEAVRHAKENIDTDDPTAKDNLLWKLFLGQSLFFDDKLSESISTFDEAETLMKIHREKLLAVDLAKDIGSILTNDNTRPYLGNTYDGIMLNTYKALAYLQQKEYSRARVEFNRAIDRQRRAKEFFSSVIAKENEALKKELSQKGQAVPTSEQIKENKIEEFIQNSYPELNAYALYPEFVNPMTNYLAALFALANDDRSKAEFLLKESKAMMPENKTIADDYQKVAIHDDDDIIWLVYEEGLAPLLDEMRVDFPAWIFTSQVNFVSIALPRMHERKGAYEYLVIKHQDTPVARTEFLSSMDRVMQTEFKNNYPRVIRRSVMSAISKAAAQKIANDSNSPFASFATAVYSLVSTQADTRLWTALPKNFHVAKFKKEDRESVDLYTPLDQKIATIRLIPAKRTLIYVKIPSLAHKVHVSIYSLGEA